MQLCHPEGKARRISWILPLIFLCFTSLSSFAQDIPNDDVTASMKQYLHALNGGDASEEKLAQQMAVIQKVRGLWQAPSFQDLRKKPLKEIIEQNIGHDFFISAVAFSEEDVEALHHSLSRYEIPDTKLDLVTRLIDRAILFRQELRLMEHFRPLGIPKNGSVFKFVNTLIERLAFKDEQYLAVVTSGGWCEILDISQINNDTGAIYYQNVSPRKYGQDSDAYSIAFSPTDNILLIGTRGKIIPWHKPIIPIDADEHFELYKLDPKEKPPTWKAHTYRTLSLAIDSEGSDLVSSSEDGEIALWVGFTMFPFISANRWKAHSHWVNALAFQPGSHVLASGSEDHDVKLWYTLAYMDPKNINIPKLRHTFSTDSAVYAVAFSPDGKLLAAGGNGSHLRLWDVETYEEVVRESDGGGAITSLSFSPDGNLLALGGYSGRWGNHEIPMINPLTGKEVFILDGEQRVTQVAFSPDGSLFVAGGEEGILKAWAVEKKVPDLGIIYLADTDQMRK